MNWICEYMYCQKDLLGIHVRFSMIDLNLIRNKEWLRVSQHLSIFLRGCSTSWEFSINKASTPKWITSPKRHGLCVYPTCDIAHHSQKWQKAQETYLAIGYHRLPSATIGCELTIHFHTEVRAVCFHSSCFEVPLQHPQRKNKQATCLGTATMMIEIYKASRKTFKELT